MIDIDKKNISRKNHISIDFFFKNTSQQFQIKLLNDEVGFDRLITDQNLHRPGLALAGFVDLFSFNRVQIFGNTEVRIFKTAYERPKKKNIRKNFQIRNSMSNIY
ncbi:MAG: hypothetical protein U5K00_02365 [Melioribacteraceae bacterium]|nr:hypothetical protein [Melioribacteraceae bacterium]